jgi:CRISPR-associated protein Cmr4
VPGSSVKGVLRDYAESRYRARSEEVWTAFGPWQERAAEARGGLVISDASLLALPVRSLYGTFAWATCPFILRRLAADAREAGLGEEAGVKALKNLAAKPQVPRVAVGVCRLMPEGQGQRLLLEERPLDNATHDRKVNDGGDWLAQRLWPEDEDREMRGFFVARFPILPDHLFGFLARTALEVRQRVKINPETGTAAASGPWSEELMPTETLLHGLVLGRNTVFVPEPRSDGAPESPRRKYPADGLSVLRNLLGDNPLLRFGGKSSGGSGRVNMRLVESTAKGVKP